MLLEMSMLNNYLSRCSNYFMFSNVGFRNFCRVKINHLSGKQGLHGNTVLNQAESQNAKEPVVVPKLYITPTNFQKRMLVWVGKYKSVADVPDKITAPELETASSKARIKTSNYMIAFTIIGCIIAIFSGREAHKRGESLTDMNLNWRKELKQQYNEEQKKQLSAE